MDIKKLEKVCGMPDDEFLSMGTSLMTDNVLVHMSRGSSVLGIAHVDTDHKPGQFYHCKETRRLWSPTLDNRLGVHILLNELRVYGVELDILLTSQDDRGYSTASDYFGPDEYNWMVSFNLRGSGVSMHQYHREEMARILLNYSLLARDTDEFPDIAELWFLGILGFDIGNGIVGQGRDTSVLLRVADRQVRRFVRFYREYKDKILPYMPTPTDVAFYQSAILSREGDHAADDGPVDPYDFTLAQQVEQIDVCDFCGNPHDITELVNIPMIGDGVFLCPECVKLQGIEFYT